MEHLNDVFKRLRAAGLKLGREKCSFCKSKLIFLGHTISSNGVAPDPAKIEKVQNFPIPRNITELRGFIGLASYYRRFIENFAKIVEPLNNLLRKDIPYEWTGLCHEAFEKLKEKLTTAPILAYPNFSLLFILYTDASYQGLGAILAQKDQENQEHVIAYASWNLSSAEQNYTVTEIECLAAVRAMRYFRPYLYMQPFDLITDHSALKWLLSIQEPSKRIN